MMVYKKTKCKTLTIMDPEYPLYLKQLHRPPIVLFYYGDISLINEENMKKNLAVIGTRSCTEYGLKETNRIVSELGKNCNIVSGLAKGIDAMAHQTALDVGTKTIAVLGSGINNPYPKENIELYKDIIKRGGLVVSEYPNFSSPLQFHFPIRNRLIAMFSKALLVTEAYDYNSGTGITARYAYSFNKKVMAIPYPADVLNSYCNYLIQEGAVLVRSAEDVFNALSEE